MSLGFTYIRQRSFSIDQYNQNPSVAAIVAEPTLETMVLLQIVSKIFNFPGTIDLYNIILSMLDTLILDVITASIPIEEVACTLQRLPISLYSSRLN